MGGFFKKKVHVVGAVHFSVGSNCLHDIILFPLGLKNCVFTTSTFLQHEIYL